MIPLTVLAAVAAGAWWLIRLLRRPPGENRVSDAWLDDHHGGRH